MLVESLEDRVWLRLAFSIDHMVGLVVLCRKLGRSARDSERSHSTEGSRIATCSAKVSGSRSLSDSSDSSAMVDRDLLRTSQVSVVTARYMAWPWEGFRHGSKSIRSFSSAMAMPFASLGK